MRWLPVLVVATVLLAGCGGEKSTPPVPQEPEGNSISGVVVTPTIQPIHAATVKILQTGEEDTTDLFGRFSFTDLDAGSYILEAKAPNYDATRIPIQVTDGEVTRLRVQMQAIAPPIARHQTLTFVGFVASNFGPADETVEPYKEQLGLSGCDCVFYFTIPRYTVAMTLEATWIEDISPPPEAHDISFTFDIAPLSGSHRALVVQGDPVHAVLQAEDFEGEGTLDFSKVGSMNLHVALDEVWPSKDQKFEIYLTLWEVDQPPAGWSFIQGSG